MNKLVLRNVTKRYGDEIVLDDLSLVFEENGLYAILGESGSGKTTILDIVSGIDHEYSGDCLIDGQSISKMDEDTRSIFRLKNIGYLRQKPDFLELDSVMDNMLLVSKSLGFKDKTIKRKAKDLLKSFGIEKKAKQTVNTLSGGERSRVSLASILMLDPSIIIADEPTGGLDRDNADFVFKSLKALSKDKLVIVVTHDKSLAAKYADTTLTLKSKKVTQKLLQNDSDDFSPILKLNKKKVRFSSFNWFSHSNRVLKKKKWRSLLSTSLLSFSLFSLGLSIYVKEDLEGRLSECFTSITGKNMMIVQKRNPNEPTFGRVIAASKEAVDKICEKYYKDIIDYGLTYLADFENYFPQENNAYILNKNKEVVIPSLSIRTFNDFKWIDVNKDKTYFPEMPETMEDSQIVLGIPQEDMAKICFALGISRSYENLGEYLMYKPLELLIRMQNDSWLYTDEHLFSVVAITHDEVPTIYHSNHRFNEYVLEEKMRFPSSDEEDHSLPWILQKVYYVEPVLQKAKFIKKTRSDDELKDFVFENCSYDYERTHDKEGVATQFNRLYVYLADKRPIDYSMIQNIADDPRISSYSLLGEHAYAMYPESLAMGFRNPFFLSNSYDDVESLSDSLFRVKEEDALARVKTKESIIQGSFLSPQNSALTFSSDAKKIISGREPENLDEICVSKGVIEKLGKSDEYYAMGMVSSYLDDGYLYRDYRISKIKVVGVVDESNLVIYGDSYWNIDFWREKLGMSSFLLEPTSVIFYLNEKVNSESLVKKWSAEYPSYKFADPSLTIKDSLTTVMGYLSIVLWFATILSLSLGLVLFLTVSILTSLEQKNEGRTLHYLGFPREEISNSYISSSTIIVAKSLLIAIISVLGTELLVDNAIQSSFGVTLPFIFSIKPIILTIFVALISLCIVSIYTNSWIKNRCFIKEKR